MKLKAAPLFALALLASAPLSAKTPGLTVRSGETWIFVIDRGQPAKARRVGPAAKPARGEVLVAVRALMGTTMTITNTGPVSYTYRAELVGAGKATAARACTLPADGRLVFEHWPRPAAAVRLSRFKPATAGGSCP